MTIEELTDSPADRWESFTDDDLLRLAESKGWLLITRPDLANPLKESALKSKSPTAPKAPSDALRKVRNLTPEQAAKARAMAEQIGFDLSSIL